jgi:hypothetical protein
VPSYHRQIVFLLVILFSYEGLERQAA